MTNSCDGVLRFIPCPPENDAGLAGFFFDESSDWMAILDLGLRIVRVNRIFSRTGYDHASLAGRSFGDLVHESDMAGLVEAFASLARDPGRVEPLKCRLRLRNGKGMDFEFLASCPPPCGHFCLISHQLAMEEDSVVTLVDPLTGLANRAALHDKGAQMIEHASRTGGLLAVLFLDLNKFKPINDTYGHAAGDLVLKTVGERLLAASRQTDLVARLGGDEFVIVNAGLKQAIHATLAAKRVLAHLCRPIVIGEGVSVSVGGSIGISLFPEHGSSIEALITAADESMYRMKKTGRQGYIFAV